MMKKSQATIRAAADGNTVLSWWSAAPGRAVA
jgi:hypothetical protein